MNDADFVNAYIDRLLNEITELTKFKLLLETRIHILEKTNASLQPKKQGKKETEV